MLSGATYSLSVLFTPPRLAWGRQRKGKRGGKGNTGDNTVNPRPNFSCLPLLPPASPRSLSLIPLLSPASLRSLPLLLLLPPASTRSLPFSRYLFYVLLLSCNSPSPPPSRSFLTSMYRPLILLHLASLRSLPCSRSTTCSFPATFLPLPPPGHFH